MNLPKSLRNQELDKKKQELYLQMSIKFKNVVMRRLEEIRKEKAKPSLKDMIMESLKKKNKKDEKLREMLKKKVMEMYEHQAAQVLNDGDVWYNRIVAHLDRVQKVITSNMTALDGLEKKLITLTSRHNPYQSKGLQNISEVERRKNFKGEEPHITEDAFKTATLGNFPRHTDDNMSSSSEEEREKRDRLEQLVKIAGVPKDAEMLKEYRLQMQSAQIDMKFDLVDSSDFEEVKEDEEDANFENEDLLFLEGNTNDFE